jgi:hypothetical protein
MDSQGHDSELCLLFMTIQLDIYENKRTTYDSAYRK